jgi:macrodomain Ter protein organizer (MatP/YcbG family)
MKTYPDINNNGVLASFEIDGWRSGPKHLARLVENKLECEITARRKWFSGNEVHFQFKFLDCEFALWEPFGDNSRYTVIPAEKAQINPDAISMLHDGFQTLRPGFFGLVTGFLQL